MLFFALESLFEVVPNLVDFAILVHNELFAFFSPFHLVSLLHHFDFHKNIIDSLSRDFLEPDRRSF